MQRATRVIRRADLAGRTCADTVTLDREARYRRRIAMTSDAGHGFLLDLAEATYMAHGDALELDDGSLVCVAAAPEDLLEVRCADPLALARIAWHIGNRHTPAEITADAIYLQPDHVLASMVARLGARTRHVVRPFEPEGGAYGSKGPLQAGHHHGTPHTHDHHHGESHEHGHSHHHGHDHAHEHHHDGPHGYRHSAD